MQVLQRLAMIGTAVGLAVFAAWNPAMANSLLLEKEGTLSSGDAVLDDGSFYDQYMFLGSSGQPIVIYLESQDFDPYLILLDPTGRRISENDDISRTNRNSRLVITLPSEGTYTVVANSYEAGKVGIYRLQVNSQDGSSATTRRLVARSSTQIKTEPLIASSEIASPEIASLELPSSELLAFSEPEASAASFTLRIDANP
jgi:hypothetical protein